MASGRAELRHGAWVAWLTFMVLLVMAVVATTLIADLVTRGSEASTPSGYASGLLLPAVLFYTVVIGGAVAAVLTLATLPVATRLDRALRPRTTAAQRVWAFAGLGAIAGVVGSAVFALLTAVAGNDALLVFFSPFTVAGVVLAAIAAGAGRASALRRARRGSIS